jgi:C-terminal peptidase prc
MWWWLHCALAGDVGLYREALRLVEAQYRFPERIDHGRMFEAAAERLEARIEPLLVTADPATARVRGIGGEWRVNLNGDLPEALAALEDAARAGGGTLDPEMDVRAELLIGALSTLDRYTTVLVGGALERFDERLSGTLSGIGVTLQRAEGALVLAEVYPDTPAERAGLRVGDVVLRVDGLSTAGMEPRDAAAHIRGPEGSRLTIEVMRGPERLVFEVERAEVNIPNVTGRIGPNGIPVVHIDHFSERTGANLDRVLADLRAGGGLERGLVLDLRGNSGGSLRQSARAADTFVESGRIVTTEVREGGEVPGLVKQIDATRHSGEPLPPVVVLVDHDTASGAEILAGALLQLGRALVVGETTFGKGTVQTLHALEADRLKLKMTAAEWVLAHNEHVNEVGVRPDVALYPVSVGELPFWYPDAERLRDRLGPGTPLIFYARTGEEADEHDGVLRFASSLLAAGSSVDRSAALAGLNTLLPTLTVLESARLRDGLKAQTVDWSAAPGPPEEVDVAVRMEPQSTARAGERADLRFTVENRGSPLHRVALRVRSVNPDLDDRVVAVGRLATGESRTVSLSFTASAGVGRRTDRLAVALECDAAPAAPALDADVLVEGGEAPVLEALARFEKDSVVVRLKNHGHDTLIDVDARLPFVDVPGLEFAPVADHPGVLAPGGELTLRQPVTLSAGHPGTLPLRLEVRARGYGRVADWDLDLPTSGVPVRIDAPRISATAARSRQPPGTVNVTVQAADDDGLEHLVVWAGGGRVDRHRWEANVEWDEAKLLYRSVRGKRVRLTLPVPVVAGSNRVVVIAEDRSGHRSRQELYVFGEGATPENDGVAFLP